MFKSFISADACGEIDAHFFTDVGWPVIGAKYLDGHVRRHLQNYRNATQCQPSRHR